MSRKLITLQITIDALSRLTRSLAPNQRIKFLERIGHMWCLVCGRDYTDPKCTHDWEIVYDDAEE